MDSSNAIDVELSITQCISPSGSQMKPQNFLCPLFQFWNIKDLPNMSTSIHLIFTCTSGITVAELYYT